MAPNDNFRISFLSPGSQFPVVYGFREFQSCTCKIFYTHNEHVWCSGLESFVVVVDIKVTILSTQKSLFCFFSLKGRDYGGKEKASSLYMVFINKASKLIGTNF